MNHKKLIRQNFQTVCFKRDKVKCVCCGSTNELTVHHITDRTEMPNGGYVKENGITVCPDCHIKAEKWHITSGTQFEEGFHPNDLYKKIESSYEKALTASKTLGKV